MTDEHKQQVMEEAAKEGVSPSFKHSPPKSSSSSKRKRESRGPSRSHPLHLGIVILAARRQKDFPNFDAVMTCVLPCEIEEAAAFFSLEQWVTRMSYCNTHEEIMDIFRLSTCIAGQNEI